MPKYILIAVVSKDGFIAEHPNQKPYEWTSKEEQEQFKLDLKNCNWSIVGRKTHELAPNNDKKRIIFTSSVKKISINKNYIFFNPEYNSFEELENFFNYNDNIAILGGTKIYDYFWEKNLITEIVLTIEPLYFYQGLCLFEKIKWKNLKKEILKNNFSLSTEKKSLNSKGTLYLHYSK